MHTIQRTIGANRNCKHCGLSRFLDIRSNLFASSDDDDYDIDFYTVDPLPAEMNDAQGMSMSSREQLEVRRNEPCLERLSADEVVNSSS